MSILFTGANGQVGRALQLTLKDKYFTALARNDLDLTNLELIFDVLNKYKPSIIIHLAAYTDVDGAEDNYDQAICINHKATSEIVSYCKKFGIPLIYLSSDYVFDGQKKGSYVESDFINPLGVYGKSKALSEETIRNKLKNYVILRTSWVYSEIGTNFFNKLYDKFFTENKLSIVSDQIGSPTSAHFIASTIFLILKKIQNNTFTWGTYHLSNNGSFSWFDFTRLMFKQITSRGINFQVQDDNILPIEAKKYLSKAKRPKNSMLNCSKIEKELCIKMEPVEIALEKVIEKKINGK